MTKTHDGSRQSIKSSPFPDQIVMKRIGADKDEVDEIVEETFVAAWRGWNTFKHKVPILPGFAESPSIKPRTIIMIRLIKNQA